MRFLSNFRNLLISPYSTEGENKKSDENNDPERQEQLSLLEAKQKDEIIPYDEQLHEDKIPTEEKSKFQTTQVISEQVIFRPVREQDKETIRMLHEECFPVRYNEDFYESMVLNKMPGGGEDQLMFSCVAVLQSFLCCSSHKDGSYLQSGDVSLEDCNGSAYGPIQPSPLIFSQQNPMLNFYKGKAHANTESDPPEIENGIHNSAIVGFVVGSFFRSSKCPQNIRPLLVRNTKKHSLMFYIMTLGAVPEFRKKGLGSELVKRCLELARSEHKCGVVYLHVIRYNTNAIRFYEKLGFVRITEIPDYYCIDGDNYNCFLYAKFINGNETKPSLFTIISDLFITVWHSFTAPLLSAMRLSTE